MKITREQMIAIGGKLWNDRVYLNEPVWAPMIELEIERYRTGNISSATLGGQRISNAKATRYLASKVFWVDGDITIVGELVRDNLGETIHAGIIRAIEAKESTDA